MRIAQALCMDGKGILNVDESNETIVKMFESNNIDNTITNIKAYKELILKTP